MAAAGFGAGGRRGAHCGHRCRSWRRSSTNGSTRGTTATARSSGRSSMYVTSNGPCERTGLRLLSWMLRADPQGKLLTSPRWAIVCWWDAVLGVCAGRAAGLFPCLCLRDNGRQERLVCAGDFPIKRDRAEQELIEAWISGASAIIPKRFYNQEWCPRAAGITCC